jgi:hypothetical protein
MRASLVCPDTGRPVSFEVSNDAKSVTRDWRKSFEIRCPHCGDMHVVAFKEVYIDGVLSSFRNDFDRMLLGPDASR